MEIGEDWDGAYTYFRLDQTGKKANKILLIIMHNKSIDNA